MNSRVKISVNQLEPRLTANDHLWNVVFVYRVYFKRDLEVFCWPNCYENLRFVAVKNFKWNIYFYFIVCFLKITVFYIVLKWKCPFSRNKMIFRHVKKAKTDSTGFKMFEWLSNFSKNERYGLYYGWLRVRTHTSGSLRDNLSVLWSSGLEEMSSGLNSLEDSSAWNAFIIVPLAINEDFLDFTPCFSLETSVQRP